MWESGGAGGIHDRVMTAEGTKSIVNTSLQQTNGLIMAGYDTFSDTRVLTNLECDPVCLWVGDGSIWDSMGWYGGLLQFCRAYHNDVL